MKRLLWQLAIFVLMYSGSVQAQTEAVLRAGDVVDLSLPGEASLTGRFQIDREGGLSLPEVGIIVVAGLSVAEAESLVRQRLAATFRDVDRLKLRLQERRLPIKVLGLVRQPGQVELPEGASVQTALQAAGGLSEGADLERLQLRRDKKVIVVNLQRFLDTGNPALLPPLQPLDTLFVPQSTQTVQVIGAIGKPGSFAWTSGLSLLELLAQAGGPTAQADLEKVQVLSTTQGVAATRSFDLAAFLAQGGDLASIPRLAPGSTLVVPELSPDSSWLRQSAGNSVYVLGGVGKPGRYAFRPGLGFMDILAVTDGPSADADLENVTLTHRGIKGPEVTKINLRLFFDTGDASLLPIVHGGDIVYVPGRRGSWLEESKESTVRVLGAVAHPARYRFDDNMTILDLLAEAGGPTAELLSAENHRGEPVVLPRSGADLRFGNVR